MEKIFISDALRRSLRQILNNRTETQEQNAAVFEQASRAVRELATWSNSIRQIDQKVAIEKTSV